VKDDPLEETRACWDALAADWRVQVGDEGDSNRRLNSDPTLWEFAGDVRGLAVLDAGCGTGYLSRKLHERGAVVTGVDLSPNMIELARAHYPGLDFRVGSCGDLADVEDGRFDLVVSNYVLMDTPELEATVREFARVLKPAGAAVLVFSHPCFPQGRADVAEHGETVRYTWDFRYFDRRRVSEPPWGHFRAEFIWFHRPLSDYWKAFTAAGFVVERFEEPRVHPDRYHLAPSARKLRNSQLRPYSVAFRLIKAVACRSTRCG
jgi:SAM-dependent methyltransferase